MSAVASTSAQRIEELDEIDEHIGALLHFAGKSLAALHPAPLSTFTDQDLSRDAPDSDDDQAPPPPDPNDRQAAFAKASDDYYATLNDIQTGLRKSIRRLRLAKASPAPLLDPAFGAAAVGTGALGVGGVALGERLKPLGSADAPPRAVAPDAAAPTRLSTAALALEAEAWRELADAMRRGHAGGAGGEGGQGGGPAVAAAAQSEAAAEPEAGDDEDEDKEMEEV